ncbi:LLM class flavin-dependent oxidoreductase [Pseudomonas sp. NPDC090201]|uniref:LLM class flavin-dependent oxidoreductase n=1 Tax=Pseudomonas sp. NPDC090201 TaxID=3364475 RepID=UPI00380D74A6
MSLLPSPLDYPDSPLSRAFAQPLMLGLFLPVQSGGWSPSALPRGTDWTFDYNKQLTLRAEALGFDLVFALAEWLGKGGYGGEIGYHDKSLDAFITQAALASVTERILLISTLHVLYGPWHPLHLAKFGATLDHISNGRWGLNLVTGHRHREHRRFGQEPIEHDQRYQQADEFIRVVQQLWASNENVDFNGDYYRLQEAYSSVKPRFGRPVLVNATGSSAGIDFAARHSDIVFTTSPGSAEIEDALSKLPEHLQRIKGAAASHGRQIRTLINPLVICRDSDAEAWEHHAAITAAGDPGALEGHVREASDAHAWRGHKADQRYVGGNIQLVGSPETVVRDILRLKQAGIDGIQLSFFDFVPDLEQFGERVLPLLHQAGLRL